jgi:hypothetical protein
MMMKMFQKGKRAVLTTADVITDTAEDMLPDSYTIPDMPNSYMPDHAMGSIGEDINLPLLVRELGARKQQLLTKQRDQLLRELEKTEKELYQLEVLITAANAL